MTGPLAEFVLARIAEDEAIAQAAAESAVTDTWDVYHSGDLRWPQDQIDAGDNVWFVESLWETEGSSFMGGAKPPMIHIARHDPARVLAECEAKRRIVGLMTERSVSRYGDDGSEAWTCEQVLELLALPYADHSDYREEWKP